MVRDGPGEDPFEDGGRSASQTVLAPLYVQMERPGPASCHSAPGQSQCPGHFVLSCQGGAWCQLAVVNESEERVII